MRSGAARPGASGMETVRRTMSCAQGNAVAARSKRVRKIGRWDYSTLRACAKKSEARRMRVANVCLMSGKPPRCLSARDRPSQ